MKNVKKLSLDLSVFEDDASVLEDDVEHRPTYQLPEEKGKLEGVFLESSHNMAFYRGDYQFIQETIGEEYSFGNSQVSFAEDTFLANVVIGGWARFENQPLANDPPGKEYEFKFGQELTYFRNMRELNENIFFEPAKKLTNAVFTIPISSMKLLIGKENTKSLMSFLDISNLTDISVQKIPMRITEILKSAVNPHLTGSMKQLYCQAKALEYLCELVELMEKRGQNPLLRDDGQSIITDIHDKLIEHVGRVPTMAELAEQYGLPARTLNTKFQMQYGLSINQYISKIRLNKAHDIIRNSDIALKIIADALGYSHVNHFITAFKRQFGYPPGSLRKQTPRH